MTPKKNTGNAQDINNALTRDRPPVWERAKQEWTVVSGYCVCPKCGKTIPHRIGRFCLFTKCPGCGSRMIRQQSFRNHNGPAKGKSTLLANRRLSSLLI